MGGHDHIWSLGGPPFFFDCDVSPDGVQQQPGLETVLLHRFECLNNDFKSVPMNQEALYESVWPQQQLVFCSLTAA